MAQFLSIARRLTVSAVMLCAAHCLMGGDRAAVGDHSSFVETWKRLEKLNQTATRAQGKRSFGVMDDARIRRQEILQGAVDAAPFERPSDFGKRSPEARQAIEDEEKAYVRLVPWIEGHRALIKAEALTRKMRYGEAATVLREHWKRTYPNAAELPATELIYGDLGAALFRTCQSATFIHPDFLSRARQAGGGEKGESDEPTAGLDEDELKEILRVCCAHDPCQVEINIMLAFLERLTNDNAFLRAENRPELEERNKLLLDLSEEAGDDPIDSPWQPQLEFLKAQSTSFILGEVKYYDTFLRPRQICIGTDHARHPFLITEDNDACLQVPTATALKPMLAIRDGKDWTASALYYVRLRKTKRGGPADAIWPLTDKHWPSSPSTRQLILSLEEIYEEYLLSEMEKGFPPSFFTGLGKDFPKADRIQQGVTHFRDVTKAGEVPTPQEVLPGTTKIATYVSRIASFVDNLADAFRTNYVREHPQMNNQVEDLIQRLAGKVAEARETAKAPRALAETLYRLSMEHGQIIAKEGGFASNVARLRRHYDAISEAIASIGGHRGITDERQKEMASRVQSLANKTRQLAILQTTDYTATAIEQAATTALERTNGIRDKVNKLVQERKTPDAAGSLRPLAESELAFLRDFRRVVTPVDEFLRDIQQDCREVRRKLSPGDGAARITLESVNQTAQLLASIDHNLSQLAPAGLFDSPAYRPAADVPVGQNVPCQEVVVGWSDPANSWRTGCIRDADELAAALNAIAATREELQTWIDADRAGQQVDRYFRKYKGKRHVVNAPLYTAEVVPIRFPIQFSELHDAFRFLPRLHLARHQDLRRLLEGKKPLGAEAVDFERTDLSRLQAYDISNVLVRALDTQNMNPVIATVSNPNDVDVSFLLFVPASDGDRVRFNRFVEDFTATPFSVETWLGDRPARFEGSSFAIDFDGLQGVIPCSDVSGDRFCRNRHWQSIRRIAPNALQRDASDRIAGSARLFELMTQDRGTTVTDRAVVYGLSDWQQLDSNVTNDFLPNMQSLAPSLSGTELLRRANARPTPLGGFLWLPICPPYPLSTP